ncbi:hypothetical protein D9613_001087 [Agrocybe pediades]|uniref:P-loop containing nucleoside triphosphate hydrolase protein n=1 Tax=Agrocybe pediades TaxID=84607 RepID=A0A8H4R139_9AGAR|nr:hypothetical protein D9613_001087 [Agrocybe pediades]
MWDVSLTLSTVFEIQRSWCSVDEGVPGIGCTLSAEFENITGSGAGIALLHTYKNLDVARFRSPADAARFLHKLTSVIRVGMDSSQDSTTSGVGLSNVQLSRTRRRMLDLVNRLHSTGVQVDIDLPQIAVIGSQSAGKSSLIESISGITLPRAAGTCTRCPTEIRLSRTTTAWQCAVFIRTLTDAKGQAIGQARNEVFGEIITDKSKVEDRIRRAQKAILNPSTPAKRFLTDNDENDRDDSELSFSSNYVSLQISGPDVADLSFVDLPGLIASVSSSSKGGGDDIRLVENLVTAYIKKENCIILLTVACETDFENQGAHRLAKQYDPQGKRTIGVLTKPDRIPTGEEPNWLPFIRNEKEPLVNNWFCVKQPSSNDLKANPTWEQARKQEDTFFSSTAPWSELDSVYQKYLRTGNLVDRLSLILSDLISKRLPQIYQELEENITNARRDLASLPPPPSDNPHTEIAALIHKFMNEVAKHVEGIPQADGLLQRIRPMNETFRINIRSTAPVFRPFEKKHDGKQHIHRAPFLVAEEGEIWDGEESDPEDGGGDVVYPRRQRSFAHPRKIFIEEVMQRANDAITREFPGRHPFFVQKTFMQEFITKWESPALNLCASVHRVMSDYIKKLVSINFGNFGQGYLEQRVKTIVHQHIEQCRNNAEEKIKWLLQLESRPFSLNTHYFTDYRDKFLTYFRGERQRYDQSKLALAINKYYQRQTTPVSKPAAHQPTVYTSPVEVEYAQASPIYVSSIAARPSSPVEYGIQKVISGLAQVGVTGITAADLHKLPAAGPLEPALTIMADVRAYFQVAYKRFADNVPLAIDQELVCGIEVGLLNALYDQLGINTPEGQEICKDLAQESPQIADRRADLKKKLERLEIAQKELVAIGS